MEYKIKTTLLAAHDKGEQISEGVYNNYVTAGCPEDWFEPVVQVEEGQYWQVEQYIYPLLKDETMRVTSVNVELQEARLESIDNSHSVKVDIDVLERAARKLSTDEVQQAIIREAKRRGLTHDREIKSAGKNKLNAKVCEPFVYKGESDSLVDTDGRGYWAYHAGNWAEIVDQTPQWEVTPTGYYVTNGKKHVMVRNEEAPAFDGFTKDQAERMYHAALDKIEQLREQIINNEMQPVEIEEQHGSKTYVKIVFHEVGAKS